MPAPVKVPPPPPLARINRVELVHTGRWPISTGVWEASRDDLAAAVAALDCPAVRNPVIKLGHSSGQRVWQGNPTGEPALGWVENLTLMNQGHTLVGDLVGLPGWLAAPNEDGVTLLAAAYPDRSIEGQRNYRCQIGHTHPFVITAVALLGVTPPGVGTLRSLHDVGRLFGVQAAADSDTVEHLAGVTIDTLDLDLWDDRTITLSFGATTITFDEDEAADLVESLNLLRGGESDQQDVHTGDGLLDLTRDGDSIHVTAGGDSVVLDLDDAHDLQQTLVDWFTGEVEVEAAWNPELHPRWPKGTPGGLGGRFMPKDLVSRRGSGSSRVVPRPAGTRQPRPRRTPQVTATSRSLTQLDERLRRIPGTTRAHGRQRSLSRSVRDIRADLNTGRITREQAIERLRQLAGREDVTADGRIEDVLWRTVNELTRDSDTPGTPQPPTPAVPETPAVPRELTPDEVRHRVERAIADIAPLGSLVGLADVRDRLQDIPRHQQDQAIRELARSHRYVLITEANQKMLGQRERDAAILHGNQRKHAIAFNEWVRPPSVPNPAPAQPAPDTAGLVATLRQTVNEAEARRLLDRLTVAQLRQVAAEARVQAPPRADRAALLEAIVQGTVGRRLDFEALSRPTNTDLPANLIPRLRDASTPAQVRQLLAGLTVRQLDQIARDLGATVRNPYARNDLVEDILRHLLNGVAAAARINQLKHYWTGDPRGLAKWATKPHPWTALYRQLRKHVGSARAKRIASQWFKEVFGIWPGERKGRNPTGPG